MFKVITISGKAEAGKDTTADILKQKLESDLKRVLIIHYADLVKFYAQKYFGWNGLKNEKGRTLLQWLGTEKVRSKFPNYWVDHVISLIEIFKDDFNYFLIPDCRFPNEVEALRKCGFDVISLSVQRLEHENTLTEEQRNHPSETALDNYKFDYTMINKNKIIDVIENTDKFIRYLKGN